MADRVVTVKLKVEDSFSQPINAYSQKIGQAEQATTRMNNAAAQSRSAFSGMGTAITGAIAAFGVVGVARLAEDLYASGVNAQRAGMLFESFGAQVGSTSALLERLRTVSRGAVDDVSLMGAASSMLGMGIAKTGDDVERLTSIAVTFAQAMGTDVASSIENMNMLISNQSYLRLDQMGIGSSQVRSLAEGYRKAGMDSADAFTAAFMDVAEQKLPQMSAVADATVTEFQKLSAAMDNWWTDFGNRFAQGVNGLIGIATHGGEAIYRGLFGWGDPAYAGASETSPGSGGNIPKTPQNASAAQISGLELIDMMHNLRTMRDEGVISDAFMWGQVAAAMAAGYTGEPYRGGGPVTGAPAWAMPGTMGYSTQNMAALGMYRGGERGDYSMTAFLTDMQTRMQSQFNSLGAFQGRAGGFFSQEEAQQAQEWYGYIKEGSDMLERLGADQQTVENFDRMATLAGQWKDNVVAGAEALANASLSQLFGQTSGGRLGEIDSAVINSLRAGGASEDTINALMRSMGLDSGQLTQMSVQFDEQVVPFLEDMATQMGGNAYNAMRRKYDEAVANAAVTNTPTVDMASLMGGFAYYPGSGTGGAANSYTVQPGDTASAIAARFGVGVGDFGLSNPSLIMPGQQLTWGGGGSGGGQLINTDFDMLEQSMMQVESSMGNAETSASTIADDMQTAADTLQSGIDAVFGKTYQLPVELIVSGAGILGQLIAAAVQANGGTVPGSSTNGGRSNAGTRPAAVNTSGAIGGGV